MELTARIFDIERFALVDGPGIRTVIFFKGCPLRCEWCHNPESQKHEFEIMYYAERCRQCGVCAKTCPSDAIYIDKESGERRYRQERCTQCMRCVVSCGEHALERVGQDISIETLVDEVARGISFFRRSKGGVTLSGGEPLHQFDACKSLLQSCHDHGIHTALDTSGYAVWDHLFQVLPYTNLILYDIKHINNNKHQQRTGVSNERVIDNLKRLLAVKDGTGIDITVRIPVIPRFNATRTDLDHIMKFLAEFDGINDLELLPFHQYGESKYTRLGKIYWSADEKVPNEAFWKDVMIKGKRLGLKVHLRE